MGRAICGWNLKKKKVGGAEGRGKKKAAATVVAAAPTYLQPTKSEPK